MIFYLASIVLALYVLWLLAFRTYMTDGYGRPTDERVTFPYIIYILLLAVCFVPILNVIFFVIFIIISLIEMNTDNDFYVRSWLFEKPGQKEKKED